MARARFSRMTRENPPLPLPLTSVQLEAVSERIRANADRLIQAHRNKLKHAHILNQARLENEATLRALRPAVKAATGGRRGRPPKRLVNHFCGLIGPDTAYGRYPYFSQDIIAGIARLDWHDRPIGSGGSSKPLSVRSLMVVLESVKEVSTESVAAALRIKTRQAQRYVKATELAMPFLMKSRPKKLVFEMNLPEDEFVNAAYRRFLRKSCPELSDELPPPTPEDLTRLRQDLGEDAFDPDRRINAAYSNKDHQRADHYQSERHSDHRVGQLC